MGLSNIISILLPMKPQSLIFVLLALPCQPASAQTIAKAEQQLIRHLEKIDSLHMLRGPDAPEDLDEAMATENNKLGRELEVLAANNTASLTYPFIRLQKIGMTIATSKDGRLRIYSWDSEMGGTAHTYSTVYQYKIGNKLYSSLTPEADSYYSDVYTVDIQDRRYYLALAHATAATLRENESIQAFALTDGTLSDTAARIIKTQSGLTNTLGFDYIMDIHAPDGNLIHYVDATKTIWFPVVLPGGLVTKKRITYRLSGKYFEKAKE